MLLRVLATSISVLILIVASIVSYLGLQQRSLRNFKIFSSSDILSFFTCFACGVFLSTCFLGLMPHLTENQERIRIQLNSTRPDLFVKYELFLDSNLMIVTGFLLIVLIEQSVTFCLPKPSSSTGNNRLSTRRSETAVNEMNMISESDNQPLVRFNSSETDTDNSDAEGGGQIEFRTIHLNVRDEDRNEHSHNHHYHFIPTGSFVQSFILLLALSSHSIFEGIALGGQTSDANFIKFLVSVMLHEVLCSFAYGIRLSKNGVSVKVAFLSILFLSLTLPMGIMFISLLSIAKNFTALIFKFVLEGLAAGTFIYVTCVEMLAEELKHSDSGHGFFKGLSLSFGIFVFFVFNRLVRV